jgi:predicted O-methyltransferase YrrM
VENEEPYMSKIKYGRTSVILKHLNMFNHTPRVVEVGVYDGINAKSVLDNITNIEMYLVDPYVEYKNPARFLNQENQNALYKKVKKKFEKDDRVTIIRKPSIEAAELFDDKSLDLVFIDGNHEYEFVKRDILAWYPKIKTGGVLSGHDYAVDVKGCEGVVRAVHEVLDEFKLDTDKVWWLII